MREAGMGIFQKCLAGGAERGVSFFMAAIEPDHLRYYALLSFDVWGGAAHGFDDGFFDLVSGKVWILKSEDNEKPGKLKMLLGKRCDFTAF